VINLAKGQQVRFRCERWLEDQERDGTVAAISPNMQAMVIEFDPPIAFRTAKGDLVVTPALPVSQSPEGFNTIWGDGLTLVSH
jgi:hypothetical protein